MVGFGNAIGSEPLTDWQTGLNQQIAFGRSSSGFVTINNENDDWPRYFTTSLPDGLYCDVYTGPPTVDGCRGENYTVSSGVFKAKILGRTALALHNGALAASTLSQQLLPIR